jgi:hypothetical protein
VKEFVLAALNLVFARQSDEISTSVDMTHRQIKSVLTAFSCLKRFFLLTVFVWYHHSTNKQKALGRTNRLPSFDMTLTAQKNEKKRGHRHTHTHTHTHTHRAGRSQKPNNKNWLGGGVRRWTDTDVYTDTQQGDVVSVILIFQNKTNK